MIDFSLSNQSEKGSIHNSLKPVNNNLPSNNSNTGGLNITAGSTVNKNLSFNNLIIQRPNTNLDQQADGSVYSALASSNAVSSGLASN